MPRTHSGRTYTIPIEDIRTLLPLTSSLETVVDIDVLSRNDGLILVTEVEENSDLPQTGVTSLIAGTGIGVDATTGDITVSNTGVTSIIAGDNISVDQATGDVTISSTGGGGTPPSGGVNCVQFDNGDNTFAGTTSFQFYPFGLGDITGPLVTIGNAALADLVINTIKKPGLAIEAGFSEAITLVGGSDIASRIYIGRSQGSADAPTDLDGLTVGVSDWSFLGYVSGAWAVMANISTTFGETGMQLLLSANDVVGGNQALLSINGVDGSIALSTPTGNVIMASLPASDPGVTGALYQDGSGNVKISL